jgi:fumarate reductase iron-sulfur subunit
MMDPRDERTDSEWFDVVSSDEGVFGCVGLMACHDICPKGLPLLEVYAYLRRKMLAKVMTPLAREAEPSKRQSSKM